MNARDRGFSLVLRGLSLIPATLVLWIFLFLLLESLPLLKNGGWLAFFTDHGWFPESGLYELTPMLVGTLSVTLGALILASPLGLLAAIFSRYYAPPLLASGFRRILELLAGIPSVIYGFWGLVTLVPLIAAWHPPGASVLAASIVLGIMILPLIALSADASLAQVPPEYWQGAAALGLTRWASIRHIALPVAGPGILAGVILQTGRALGETMAVLMVVGNVVQLPSSWFEPARTLTANIALEMAYATGDHRTALFASGLLLLVTAALMVAMASVLQKRGSVHVPA